MARTRRVVRLTGPLLLLLVVLGLPASSLAIEDGSDVELGLHRPPAPWDGLGAIAEREQQLAHPVGIVHWFQSWDSGWQPGVVGDVVDSGRTPLITWEPAGIDLDGIAEGAYDDYLASWADGLAAVDAPVYLRPFPEMNGEWTEWNGDPDALVAAWRHVTGLFAERGADNVRWVWSPNETDEPRVADNRMERYWPGVDHVDVLGLSGFNWGGDHPTGWRSFSEIFAEPVNRVRQLADLPVWLTEVASAESDGAKGAWIADMVASLSDFPAVGALVWFDENKERDWRIDSSSASFDSFQESLNGPDDPDGTDAGGDDEQNDNDTPSRDDTTPISRQRLAGASRYATAAAVSQSAFPDGAEQVYLATGENYPDALAAASLQGSPVLLTPSCGALPEVVAGELERLAPSELVALGGQAAVCDAVLDRAGAAAAR